MKDESGTPTPTDTDTAKKLTEGLRDRAKLGSGPYQIAGNSEKELIDEKLLKNCDNEADKCMAQIGNDLGADWLMFGKIEKKNGAYVVSMKLLDVHGKRLVKSSTDPIPLSQAANDVSLKEWAQKIYAKLTGEKSAGSLIVKVTNADRGTILINGEEKGTFNNGTGTVAGLEENRYKVTVESQGYKPWEDTVSVKSGEATNKSVTLEKSATPPTGNGGIIEPPGNGVGPGSSGLITSNNEGNGGAHGSAAWKGVFVSSIVVGLAGGGLVIVGKRNIDSAHNEGCPLGGTYSDYTCPTQVPAPPTCANNSCLKHSNDLGNKGQLETWIGGGMAIGGGTLAIIAFYEGFIAKSGDTPNEHADKGHRVHRDRFVVRPIVSPDGGGATLQLDW